MTREEVEELLQSHGFVVKRKMPKHVDWISSDGERSVRLCGKLIKGVRWHCEYTHLQFKDGGLSIHAMGLNYLIVQVTK